MCVRVYGMLEDIRQCPTHFSGFYPKYQLWANTMSSVGHTLYYLPVVKCLLQTTEHWLLNNGLFKLDLNLQHTVFVWLFDLLWLYASCMYISWYSKYAQTFIYLFDFFEVLCFFCFFFHIKYFWDKVDELLAKEPIVIHSGKERERASSPLLCCVMRLLWGRENSLMTISCFGARK